jgi:hypothetical protein
MNKADRAQRLNDNVHTYHKKLGLPGTSVQMLNLAFGSEDDPALMNIKMTR